MANNNNNNNDNNDKSNNNSGSSSSGNDSHRRYDRLSRLTAEEQHDLTNAFAKLAELNYNQRKMITKLREENALLNEKVQELERKNVN